GAVLGPLIVSVALYITGNFYLAFSLLALPAATSIIFLFNAYARYPRVKAAEEATSILKSGPMLSRVFWLYTASMSLIALGFIHWVNISYYLRAEGVLPDYLIATMYLVAMLVDGLLAFPMGLVYDRVGLVSLLLAPMLSALVVLTLFMNNFVSVLLSSIFWGAVMGIYESTARAAIADIVPLEGRTYGYGVFGALFGVAWMAGSIIYGYLYQNLNGLIIPFTITVELSAFISLLISIKIWKTN
ncbi:MAG: MFS transporter, partial [Candidatus Bathyarchaeia archaeon]